MATALPVPRASHIREIHRRASGAGFAPSSRMPPRMILLMVCALLATPAFAEVVDGACQAPSLVPIASLGDDLRSLEARERVESAIAKLDAQRNSAPFAPYYADGARVEGCWANPAGSKLTEIQKAF